MRISDWSSDVCSSDLKEAGDIDLANADQVVWRDWPQHAGYITRDDGLVACRIYGHIKARHLWAMNMVSTFVYAPPGFILIDRIYDLNQTWTYEERRVGEGGLGTGCSRWSPRP